MKAPENLISPPGTQTDKGFALVWNRTESVDVIKGYNIYVNGRKEAFSTRTDYTFNDLDANTEYKLYVTSEGRDGIESEPSNTIQVRTLSKRQIFDVIDFGARGDGKFLDTAAIQTAIDACCENGIVYFPAGKYLSGAIYLKSNMALHLDEGAVLSGCNELENYPIYNYRFEGKVQPCHASLINVISTKAGQKEFTNIIIEGKGTIDANGTYLKTEEIANGKATRGRAVFIENGNQVYFKDITICHSPAWCVHTAFCTNVVLDHVTIRTKYAADGSKYDVFNGDGFDPDSCKNVWVFNSSIESQDDCIAIKSGRDEEGRRVGVPTENVRITNCTFKYGFGVAVGSEMSGSVRDVLVQDCDFEDTYSFASIKAPRGRGGVVEGIVYDNIHHQNNSTEHKDCKWFRGALYIDQFYSHDNFNTEELRKVNDGTAVIKDIVFKNIDTATVTGNAVFLAGLPESLLKNITLENVKAAGKYGLKAYNIEGLSLLHTEVTASEGEAYQIAPSVQLNKI